MARACDAGVDVIEVLIEELTSDLVRRGFRRVEIEDLRRRAEREIDHQRRIGGSADIVDLVMGLARQAHPAASARRQPLPRRRVVGHHIMELRQTLTQVLAQPNKSGSATGARRQAERNLIVAVVGQATRDQSMSAQQAAQLLAVVPTSKAGRKKREARGIPNVPRLLSRWL